MVNTVSGKSKSNIYPAQGVSVASKLFPRKIQAAALSKFIPHSLLLSIYIRHQYDSPIHLSRLHICGCSGRGCSLPFVDGRDCWEGWRAGTPAYCIGSTRSGHHLLGICSESPRAEGIKICIIHETIYLSEEDHSRTLIHLNTARYFYRPCQDSDLSRTEPSEFLPASLRPAQSTPLIITVVQEFSLSFRYSTPSVQGPW